MAEHNPLGDAIAISRLARNPSAEFNCRKVHGMFAPDRRLTNSRVIVRGNANVGRGNVVDLRFFASLTRPVPIERTGKRCRLSLRSSSEIRVRQFPASIDNFELSIKTPSWHDVEEQFDVFQERIRDANIRSDQTLGRMKRCL